MRELGIPTVLDRFIQQALLQVLQPGFDASFSKHSYGFRPKRSAHDAVRAAKRYVEEGLRVMGLLRRLFGRLRLRVNESKSAVDLAEHRKVLGYTFWEARDGSMRLQVAHKPLATLKARTRRITRRTGGGA